MNVIAERGEGTPVLDLKTNPVISGVLAGQIPRRGANRLVAVHILPKIPIVTALDADGEPLVGANLDNVYD